MRPTPLPAGAAAALAILAGTAFGGTTLTTEIVDKFTSPLFVTGPPGDDRRLFVIERAGVVRLVLDGIVQKTAFLDITSLVDTDFEGGLLGIAMHPDYETNGRFFLNYTAPGLVTIVAEYRRSSADPHQADPSSATQVLAVAQPAANHNAGWLGFSPVNGYLYVAMGDGGFSGSGQRRAQDTTDQLLGKMLRIDIDGDDFPGDPNRNYAIPGSNPFVGVTGDDEIWALGLRNPFRCSFDRLTGDLFIGDVGAGSWEEVNYQCADDDGGRNYGWGCMEGFECNGTECTCNDPSLTLPIHVYSHAVGCSITGGSIYRGCAIPELDGVYFFADFCANRVWSFRLDPEGGVTQFTDRTSEIDTLQPVAISEDGRGELYVVSITGTVSRIIAATPPKGDPCAVVGDVTGDGRVDFADLVRLLTNWGACEECPEDLDGSGAVDFADVLIVLGNWT